MSLSVACLSPTYSVIGASFPGVPAIVLGHNDWMGWGITNTGADVQDTFIMYERPNNDTHYLYQGAYIPYDIRTEVIDIAGGRKVRCSELSWLIF